MRTKHGLIDFEDVYVEPNVWRQLGLSCRSDCTYRVAEGSPVAAARHSAKSNGRSQLHRTGVFHPLSGCSTFRVLMLSICALLTFAWASMLLPFISVIG